MSVTARVVRQFSAGDQILMLEKVLALPAAPTMGARLALNGGPPLEVVAVTLHALPADPVGFLAPAVDVFLAYEPLAAADEARADGWATSPRRRVANSMLPLRESRS